MSDDDGLKLRPMLVLRPDGPVEDADAMNRLHAEMFRAWARTGRLPILVSPLEKDHVDRRD